MPEARRSRTRLLVWVRGGAAAALATVALLVGAAWWSASAAPGWYRRAAVINDPALAAQRAEALERGAASALSERRDEAPWSVEVKEEDAGAWVEHRLPRWLANRGEEWPDGVDDLRLRFDAGRVLAAGRVGSRVVSASAVVEVRAGRVTLIEPRAAIGRLPLPMGIARGLAGRIGVGERELRAIVESLQGESGWPATHTLDDGRSVELLSITLEGGRARLVCRTVAAGGRSGEGVDDSPAHTR